MYKIGILGAAGIAVNAMIWPVRRRDDVVVQAVASRANAAEYAARHGIERTHTSYQDLIDDPGIDLVYNALPPSLHAEWTIAALRAGKDVLCEKPFAMTAAQARRVVDTAASSGRRVIEAFHDHYHPLSEWLRESVAAAEFGRIIRVEAVFDGPNAFAAGTLRHEPDLGGGALMDLGCYPVHWVRTLFGEPLVVGAEAVRNPAGADESIRAELDFAGVPGLVRSSMNTDVVLRSALRIESDRGWVEVDNLVFPSAGHSIRSELDGIPRASTVAGRQTYDHQLDAVLAALRTGEPAATEGADIVANMTVIDHIYAAAGFTRAWT